MEDPTLEVLDPDQEVRLGGEKKVVVRELNWKAAKAFLGKLAMRSAEFLTIGPGGSTEVDSQRLVNIIVTSLGEELILAATDLTQAEVEALSLSDLVRVLDRAVEVNLRPEMIEAGKAVAGRFTALARK